MHYMTYKKSDIWSVMRKSVQKEEILRMKNYKILISDSTVLSSKRLHSGSNKKIRTLENSNSVRATLKKNFFDKN